MEKMILLLIFCFAMINLNAQVEVKTSTFDLENITKEKWKIYGGYKAANGELVLKLGSPKCDMSKNSWTGSYTFSGVEWDFEELHFDSDMKYISKESKHFNSSIEALAYEPVWGKKFAVMAEGWAGGAGINFDNSYIGKKTIIASSNMFGQPSIINGYIYSQVATPSSSQKIVYACSEIPTLKVVSTVSPKEAKGEKWMFVKGYHEPGSGVIFYQRAGTGMDDSKMNYVLNKYDENATQIATKLFTFEYNNTCQIIQLTKANGESDYVIISQAVKKSAPKGAAIKEADYAEVILIDGKTLDIKMQEEVKLKYSKWFIRYGGYTPEGNVFLFGPAAESNTEYLPMPGSACMPGVEDKAFKGYGVCNIADESPNLQTILIQNNKVASINGVSKQEAAALQTILEGSPYKAKANPVFTATTDNLQRLAMDIMIEQQNFFVHHANNKIVMSFETFTEKKGAELERNGWATLILDANGKLEKYLTMPTAGFSTSNQLFSSDKKTMYWTCYEPNALNSKIGDNGVYEPKAVKNMLAGQLMLAKVDLTTNTSSKIQMIGEKEYAVNAKSPLVADTDTEIIFQGKTLNKKAKDSELILIKVKK